MRQVVFDTNTVVSALLWRGVSYRLLHTINSRPATALFSSPFLLNELSGVLARTKFDVVFAARKTSRPVVIREYEDMIRMVYPVGILDAVPNDPTDNNVLACALAADADVIVSGDRHLLSLNGYEGMEIMSAGDCLARLEQEFA